jgi:hypothetical protein
MKLTSDPGEIYFIGESDRLTQEKTQYFKIGLVREKEGRSSADRMPEHQTGNPRALTLLDVVMTPFVSATENILHRLFATRQVLGEWFHLSDEELQGAISQARSLAADLESAGALLAQADELAKQESDDLVVTADDSVRQAHARLLALRSRAKFVEGLNALLITEAREAAERGEDTSEVVQAQERKGSERIDEAALELAEPEIWAKFTTSTSHISARFTIEGVRKLPEVSDIDPDLYAFGQEFTAAAEAVRQGQARLEDLHFKTLELSERTARIELDADVAAAELKIACGTHAGVDGICKWKRFTEIKTKFDRQGFRDEYPELAVEYTVVGEARVANKRTRRVAAKAGE